MNKIPVGDTVRFAYRFTFGQIGTIIGLIWIAMLVIVVGSYFSIQPYYAAMAETARTGILPSGAPMLMAILFQIIELLLIASMSVAITQQALGLRQGQVLAHFSLGVAELRVYGGMLGLFLLLLLFSVFYEMGLRVADLVAKALEGEGTAGWFTGHVIEVTYGIAGFCALFYMLVRLSFLFIPAAVAEGGFGIARSWEITKGNFWRIFAIACATILPVLAVFLIAEVVILGPHFVLPDFTALSDQASQARAMAGQMAVMQKNLPYLLGLSFVIAPVLYGLLLAPAAFAWRALTAKPGIDLQA